MQVVCGEKNEADATSFAAGELVCWLVPRRVDDDVETFVRNSGSFVSAMT